MKNPNKHSGCSLDNMNKSSQSLELAREIGTDL